MTGRNISDRDIYKWISVYLIIGITLSEAVCEAFYRPK